MYEKGNEPHKCHMAPTVSVAQPSCPDLQLTGTSIEIIFMSINSQKQQLLGAKEWESVKRTLDFKVHMKQHNSR